MFDKFHDRDPTRITVLLLYGIMICRSMVFLVPIIVLFFAQEVGLSFQEFLASEAVFAATVVAMEVPSGWLADVWKRKWAIALGGLFAAVGVALFIPADSFFDTAIANALMGVGISLFSGADSALLYDTLLQWGREKRYRVIEGRRHGFGLYAVALSSAAGAWLYATDPMLPVWAMVAAYLATSILAMFLREPERQKQTARRTSLKDTLAANRVVVIAILAGAVLFSSTSVAMWSQQPYYIRLGIDVQWFGLLTALGFLAGGLGGQFGHHLDRWLGALGALAALWAVLVIAFAVAGLWLGWGGVALLLLGPVMWGAGWPQLQTIINQRVGPARRATALSFAGAAIRLAFIPLSSAIGFLNTVHGIAWAVVGLAAILFTLGGPALWLLRREAGPAPAPGISLPVREG